ncbi:ABC transporter ATP-binding protein [Pseudodonghicola flavimaris]|uniref:ABC transporter ATP-binding protein n=1 Tax=Pseudodonghicola flavimaris TaxID=3050036 RepID=A0ABT7F151_9RHOB|nr:ABC transporter ATP-binding protein [Pseudodonghicola flavimaris]MDK3018331.1 ABC transporter ATP-binding protein [Pseudodonghicola flavimaris]
MTAILTVTGLCKRFGGLTATDNVSLEVKTGEIHALIGPNGAGKSTLINQLCGELAPDAGRIELGGREITHDSPEDRVHQGLGRTFQITSLLEDFTVRQNLGLAIQARAGGNLRIWDRVGARRSIWAEADRRLGESGLAARAGTPVADLSHGEKKQLELILALAGEPRLLLLDEPMAGLGHVESQQMIAGLNGLRGHVSMLLVEHDMDAVFALADRISVLVYGQLLMTGTAEEIRRDARVREAYLGGEEELC